MTDADSAGWTERRTGLVPLSEDECWRLLGEHRFGRVGVVSGREPLVLPVNYGLDGRRIVFRTGAGTKFHAIVSGSPISLEIDQIDPAYHAGWSVLAVGRAVEADDVDRDRLEAEVRLGTWAGGDKSHWIVLEPSRVTGRSVALDKQP